MPLLEPFLHMGSAVHGAGCDVITMLVLRSVFGTNSYDVGWLVGKVLAAAALCSKRVAWSPPKMIDLGPLYKAPRLGPYHSRRVRSKDSVGSNG